MKESIEAASNYREKMVSYTTVRGTQTNLFTTVCFHKPVLIWLHCSGLPKRLGRKISKPKLANGEMKDGRKCVNVVMPSEWAKYDMSFHPTYTDIVKGEHNHDASCLSIERTPIVNGREHSIGNTTSFWSIYKGNIINVDIGTLVSIPVNTSITADSNLTPWTTQDINGQHVVVCKTGPQ